MHVCMYICMYYSMQLTAAFKVIPHIPAGGTSAGFDDLMYVRVHMYVCMYVCEYKTLDRTVRGEQILFLPNSFPSYTSVSRLRLRMYVCMYICMYAQCG